MITAGIAFLLVFSSFNLPLVLAGSSASASSSESPLLSPAKAVDGNLQTRWSSRFSDPQWIQLDFGESREIAGVTLFWEAAYAKSYLVQTSDDGRAWRTVYEMPEAEGGTDDLYFERHPARFLRVLGRARATTWGYSLYEIKVKGAEEGIRIESTSRLPGYGSARAMDGKTGTEWRSRPKIPQKLTLDLRKESLIGGLEIEWGRDPAAAYEIAVSKDGKNWKKLWSGENKREGKAKHYFAATGARFIQLRLREACCGSGFSVKEILLKGADKAASPQRLFELEAETAPPGSYPMWLSKRQSYWTVVGVDGGDPAESLMGEDGTVEPYKDGFSVMPYLWFEDRLLTADDCYLTQSLEKGYLPVPSVRRDCKGLILDQKLVAHGEPGRSSTYVRYRVENRTGKSARGKLFLTVRPLQVNPPWQYGGISAIRSIRYLSGHPARVSVNGADKIFAISQPEKFGATAFADGDIIRLVGEGRLPSSENIEDPQGMASAALEYGFRLGPESSIEFTLAFPLHEAPPGKYDFDSVLSETVRHWERRLKTFETELLDARLIAAVKSNLAYLLINRDGPALQPGSRNYQKSWMRDGSESAVALLRMGFTEEVRQYIDWITIHQGPDGFIPFMLEGGKMPEFARDWTEYDSQGQYVATVYQYFLYTGDRKFLEQIWPSVILALKFLENLRKQNLDRKLKWGSPESRNMYGILPKSNSHEGYFPAVHSYWDDFWALKGWKDAREMAKILGRRDQLRWISREEEGLRIHLYRSIEGVIRSRDLDYIPSSVEKGDYDPNSTAIAIVACGELDRLPRGKLRQTFSRFYADFLKRFEPGWQGSFTPYEVRTVEAMLRMGRKDEALKMLDYFLTVMRPRAWNHLAEVVFSDPRHPQYIGDMPHTWVGAEFINSVRSLLVYEQGKTLVLGHGLEARRLSETEAVTGELITAFGKMSYSVKKNGWDLEIKVRGNARPGDGFVFKSPFETSIKKVMLNEKKWRRFSGGEVRFETLPADLVLHY